MVAVAPEDPVDISIHTPLAGSDWPDSDKRKQHSISIHTPLAGSDPSSQPANTYSGVFQSTLPLRGVTNIEAGMGPKIWVSIHTPLAGSDSPIG